MEISGKSITIRKEWRSAIITNGEYDIRRFGAAGDGETVATRAIQQAIDECSRDGGGTVIVREGQYVTGTIYLKDNVTVNVTGGAALLGSTNIDDYATDTHKNMYDGEPHMDRCLIFARDAKNIGLSGSGLIDGRGHRKHFPNAKDKDQNRPMLIRFLNCTGITVRDIALRNPASWTSAWLYCDDIVVEGVSIHSRVNENGDGLDFDGCQRVRVSNCSFSTSDDSICLQTSRVDKPCKDVVISNCVFSSRWAGMRIGLLSMGNFENVTITNCTFRDIQDSGLKIQMCEGGEMRDMLFANLVMSNVPRPIFMTFNRQKAGVDSPDEVPPMRSMHNFQFSNIRIDSSATGKDASILITGVPGHCIENISLSDVCYTAAGGGTREDGATRSLREYLPDNISFHRWPEYDKLGATVPCFGVYARHVKGLTLSNVRLETAAEDMRPAIVCSDVAGLELDAVKMRGSGAAESLIRLQDVRGAFIHSCWARGESEAFLRVEGSQSDDITVSPDNLHRARTPISTSKDVRSGAITDMG